MLNKPNPGRRRCTTANSSGSRLFLPGGYFFADTARRKRLATARPALRAGTNVHSIAALVKSGSGDFVFRAGATDRTLPAESISRSLSRRQIHLRRAVRLRPQLLSLACPIGVLPHTLGSRVPLPHLSPLPPAA